MCVYYLKHYAVCVGYLQLFTQTLKHDDVYILPKTLLCVCRLPATVHPDVGGGAGTVARRRSYPGGLPVL